MLVEVFKLINQCVLLSTESVLVSELCKRVYTQCIFLIFLCPVDLSLSSF